ncbi:MAG: surface lipoprotein assembly modifier [Croceibacterium sp.]
MVPSALQRLTVDLTDEITGRVAACKKLFGKLGAAGMGMLAVMAWTPARAQEDTQLELSAADLFAFAAAAEDRSDYVTAEASYRALAQNPDIALRSEARFRLALMLADRVGKPREAAVELRRILDEQPNAAPVRVQLARINARLGNIGAAERELRAAEAGGDLPPEVAQAVRFYANALSASKPLGGSLEIALAPDNNVNRATRSDTLGTVIGDFTLSDDARAQSGLGLALRGQTYFRVPLESGARLLARASTSADVYRKSAFDDIALGLQVGPEFQVGADRITLSAGPVWRWYGLSPYSLSLGGSAAWQHPMGRRGSFRLDLGALHIDNRRNDLQDGEVYTLAASVDRAFSARFGVGGQANVARTTAVDSGYADVTVGGTLYGFRELGRSTAVLSLGYSRLEADGRLFLYPHRRTDDRFTAIGSLTLRRFRIGTFAPYVRVRLERNASTIGIYDFTRVAGETGLTAAF